MNTIFKIHSNIFKKQYSTASPDCDGETVIGCPQLIHDFACWIGTNYMEGERIKIYIEPNAHAGLDQ